MVFKPRAYGIFNFMEPATTPKKVPSAHSAELEWIGVRVGYCGGSPHILGHRIKVKHVVVWHEQMNMSLAEIVETYPTIKLTQVRAALAYYHEHRDVILAEIEREARLVEGLEAEQPSVYEKARSRHAQDDPFPPR